ncbi:CRISPR-associated helicase/endonuclease Cas3 [Amphritea pacifica]|uniref:CRISPR-associated helicase/endonuclease Cas3 n=1 Tax=Amphritea pacifica TaxID=2811233 RepID=A0ABS2WD72_9GAMM|nr:CRISPR-associated helicase/endonuclease Cas3 [Amphritea pacifica]MBN0989526.1 CRISPR-associated helicase/endonuclease Cas3 [Amphritea pacifica]
MDTIPSYMRYWGKAKKDPDSEGPDYHLLPYHCLDVAAVAQVWLSASPTLLFQIAKQMNTAPKKAQSIILFYILLHDLGKFDARFQNFREDIRQILQGDDWEVEPDSTYYSHGSCGYQQFCQVFGGNQAMKAVAGHHGFCDMSFDYFEPDADGELIELDIQARQDWIDFCLHFCQLDTIPEVGEISLLAGLCSVSDWIGSSITNFTADPDLPLEQYYQRALPRAEVALKATGMIERILGAGFRFLFPGYEPRGVQGLLDDLPIKPGLTLVEADTGAGKTEFALAYASILIKSGLADGVVFGLPTQATANGLFSRIGKAAAVLFPDALPTLAHGKSKYLLSDMSDESGFLQQSNKRAFLGTVSVATIDQILMGVLSVRHQFVRSFGTRKSVLVLDEIHSFDPYMMGLIEQVLKGQHQAYASVILLSATLPEHTKEKLLSCYKGESSSEEYPLVTHTDLSGNTTEFPLPESLRVSKIRVVKTHVWQSENCLPNSDQIAQIDRWARKGGVVAVVCNTVADAQKLYLNVMAAKPGYPVDLFHARYAFADRERIEKQVLADYGKEAKRTGRLLIATQVIEQSLDLDFDIMISQIAPVEYLMQRMGRLWRHDRLNSDLPPRTNSILEPLFITLVPESELTPETNIKQAKQHYSGSGYVYQNVRWLYRTQQFLQRHPELFFPDCYRSAIRFVHTLNAYHSEPDVLSEIADAFELKGEGSNYTARQISSIQSRPLNDVDPRCALLTRDGEMSVSVVLFNEEGELLHGGDFNDQQDRERSLISLAPKHARGQKCPEYYCHKAIVGKDIYYNELGFVRDDMAKELNIER